MAVFGIYSLCIGTRAYCMTGLKWVNNSGIQADATKGFRLEVVFTLLDHCGTKDQK